MNILETIIEDGPIFNLNPFTLEARVNQVSPTEIIPTFVAMINYQDEPPTCAEFLTFQEATNWVNEQVAND